MPYTTGLPTGTMGSAARAGMRGQRVAAENNHSRRLAPHFAEISVEPSLCTLPTAARTVFSERLIVHAINQAGRDHNSVRCLL